MKTARERLDDALDEYPDQTFIVADDLDDAVIGLDVQSSRVIYSVRKCLEILVASGMTAEDAEEHFDFNIRGAFISPAPPIWCDDEWLADDDKAGGLEDIEEV